MSFRSHIILLQLTSKNNKFITEFSYMNFSKTVRKRRIVLMMTQNELAKKTGLNVRTIQRIENNEAPSSLYTKRKISQILNLKKIFNRYFFCSQYCILIGLLIIIIVSYCFYNFFICMSQK